MKSHLLNKPVTRTRVFLYTPIPQKICIVYNPKNPPPSEEEVLLHISQFLSSSKAEGYIGKPYWPGGKSGITIDFGFDIGQHSEIKFRKIWEILDKSTLDRLALYSKKDNNIFVGSQIIANKLADIKISKESAMIILKNEQKKYYNGAKKLFPGLNRLPWQVQVAATSIVYNRGSVEVLHHDKWESFGILPWQEMRAIKEDIWSGNLFSVYDQIKMMSRIWWDTKNERGLTKRRFEEANLIWPIIAHGYNAYHDAVHEFGQDNVYWNEYLEY